MIIFTKNLSGLAKVLPFAFSKVLSFAVLLTALLFVGNAGAACNIKLHVQAPPDDWSDFHVLFGTGTSVANPPEADKIPSGATADAATGAGWYVADLSTLNPGTPNQGFLLTRTLSSGTKIGGGYNIRANATTTFLACPTGANGGNYYLYEDPENPGRSLLTSAPPSSNPGGGSSSSGPGGGSSSSTATARTFYFLPPDDPEWISSTPFVWLDAPGQTPVRMSIDAARCGWYKAEYAAGSIPSGNAYILRSSSDFSGNSTYRIGLLGMTEDPSDWVKGFPTPFDLSKQFSEISSPAGSRNLFFAADAGEWSATDPMINETARCSYNFAAIIYDTDRSVNCSFNPNNNTSGWSTAGFKKGIVQSTLDANRKLQFNSSAATERCSRTNESSNTACVFSSATAAPANCVSGWSGDNFRKAWNATDPSNVVRCYDMPFQRSTAGLWEFNSNKLCRNGNVMDLNGNCSSYGGYLGGFFPNELQTRGDADYSNCPECDTKYSATGWQGLANNVSEWCYNRAWRGTGNRTGNLSSAGNTAEINAVMTGAGCTEELNGSTTNLYSNTANGSPGQRNFFFCFESHAEFTYEPGQEFFFSGDDDVWIFINNKLALDIGGVHSAVPGYIKLDTIKPALASGEKYPIDIFFCERNLNQSNIRITTNMYFSQQSGLVLATKDPEIKGDVCLIRSGTGNSCQEMATGGNKLDTLCGTKDNFMRDLRYYIANRAGTAGSPLTSLGLPNAKGIILDANSPDCTAGNVDGEGHTYLLCYGGIKIYESLGKVQVLEDDVVGLIGTWRVWANYVGPITPKPPSMRVAEFTKNAKVRVVWGTLTHSVTGAVIGELPPIRTASTVAGKPVKVGFAVADGDANRFTVSMETGGSPGQTFTLAGSSFNGISILDSASLSKSSFLRVFADSLGQEEYDKNKIFVIPPSGYLELWFTGSFDAEDDARYTISASGTTASTYVLDVYQPRLRFVASATTAATASAAAILPRTAGSRFDEANPNQAIRSMIAWTGEQMERTLVAFDPTPSLRNQAAWVPCGIYCNFTLRNERETYDGSLSGSGLMDFIPGTINVENGIAKFNFVGMENVKDDKFAYFSIYGPSKLEAASAKWDSLQFEKPPVPTPSLVEIYDRKGGGRGDSIVIVYNETFLNAETGLLDGKKLPNKIEVFWDEGRVDTITYGLGVKGADGKYYFSGTAEENILEWQPRLLNDFTIVLVRDDYDDSFSGQRIKTAGEGKVVSWETFNDPVRGPQTIPFTANITDRIPPVVISAKFLGDERECGTPSSPCNDQITVLVSEPVKLVNEEVNPDASKTAFAYILKSFVLPEYNFDVYNNQSDQPSTMRWRNSGTTGPAVTGDSVVYLAFRAYRSDNNTAYTPSAGDSIRFLAGKKGPSGIFWDFSEAADSSLHPFTDLKGNKPHPLEWGTLIEGKKRFVADPIRIDEISPNDPDKVKNALTGIVDDPNAAIEFFTPDRPIELIPVPDGWSLAEVRANYPGSVGVVFRPDISNGVINFEEEQKRRGVAVKVADSDISFHAKSYIHTNLGNFVVKRELTGTSTHPIFGADYPNSLKCSDPIFNIDGSRSCRTGASGGNSNMGVYLAWNLKSAPVKKGPLNGGSPEGRLAGAGAYVQVYDFWWEINVKDASGNLVTSGPLNKVSKIDMFGVKRRK